MHFRAGSRPITIAQLLHANLAMEAVSFIAQGTSYEAKCIITVYSRFRYESKIGQHLKRKVSWLSADSWPTPNTIGWQLADSSSHKVRALSADSRLTEFGIGQLSVDCWPTGDRLRSAVLRPGESISVAFPFPFHSKKIRAYRHIVISLA